MKILFLPNFVVSDMDQDDPSISPPNKKVKGRGYWFFRHLPKSEVTVLDNRSTVVSSGFGRLLKFEVFQALKAFIIQKDYDVIISHSYNSGLVLALARSLLRQKRPHHFVIDVGSLNGGRDSPLQIAVIRFSLKSVAGLIYHSSVNEEFYAKFFPEIHRQFVYFGNDPNLYPPSEEEPEERYALSIGYAFRDYETLIKAWTDVDFLLKIVGMPGLDLKSNPSIELIDKVPISRLSRLIQGASLVVLPISNVRYSIGQMTLTQCMSMRKAIVVSQSYGVIDYCRSGANCLTYENGNASDLAEKVKLLLANPDMARDIADNARNDILSIFSEQRMAEGIQDFVLKRISELERRD